MKLVDIFKALGDETRIRIINILKYDKLCVCEIEIILEITQSNASRHLNKLKNAGIIDYIKKSQWIYYFIAPDFIEKSELLFEYTKEQMAKNDKLNKDSARLRKYKESGYTCKHIKDSMAIFDS